jgi:hypothetical protein
VAQSVTVQSLWTGRGEMSLALLRPREHGVRSRVLAFMEDHSRIALAPRATLTHAHSLDRIMSGSAVHSDQVLQLMLWVR